MRNVCTARLILLALYNNKIKTNNITEKKITYVPQINPSQPPRSFP